MRVFVLGEGAREKALARACHFSDSCEEVHIQSSFALPYDKIKTHHLIPEDKEALSQFLKSKKIDLVIIGPEKYCIDGYSDYLRAESFKVFAPSQEAAWLEGSKIFAKEFMKEMNIPTARYKVVKSLSDIEKVHYEFTPPYVLKADGLAGGKGVFICKNLAQLKERAHQLFEDKIFQDNGTTAILEEYYSGDEISFFVLTNGSDFEVLPLAKDYKKLFDGGLGPNTGGMGAFSPMKLEEGVKQEIIKTIVEPTILGLKKRNFVYRGVIYIGVIFSELAPKVLEYNVRFGDPEAQALLPLLKGDPASLFFQIADGKVPEIEVKENIFSTCVVMTSQGYPFTPAIGQKITGDVFYETENSYFLHGGVVKEGDSFFTKSGRVMSAVCFHQDKIKSIEGAYKQASQADWKDSFLRSDIGIIGCL